MTTVQELIDAGFAEEKDADTIILKPTIEVKKAAIEADLMEDFAAMYGWTATVKDEEGNDIDNPVKAYEKCREIIAQFVRDTGKAIIINRVDAAAQAQKDALISQLT